MYTRIKVIPIKITLINHMRIKCITNNQECITNNRECMKEKNIQEDNLLMSNILFKTTKPKSIVLGKLEKEISSEGRKLL